MTIRSEFQVHMLNDKGKAAAEELAQAYSTLLEVVEKLVPNSREKSLAVTHMQDSCFWAKRGLAMQPENQRKSEPGEG